MSENVNIFVTGPPRSGKSTLVGEIIGELDMKAEGLRTPDIRKNGKRKGFKLVDIKSGEEGVLAHVDVEEGPKVSRYTVDRDDLERMTEKSLENVSDDCGVVVIDEIGTMELFSDRFEKVVEELLRNDISVLAVLHRNHVGDYGDAGEVFDLGKEDYEVVKKKIKKTLEGTEG